MTTAHDRLLESYQRLHAYGPEFGGDEEGDHGMTNHGPMAVEVIVRRGLDVDVDRWLDRYVRRLAEPPSSGAEISRRDWRAALGSARRLPAWTRFFRTELRERPWTDVLTEWWPRLLPGIVAGSTHGVIRVGHAVRALRDAPGASPAPELVEELAHGLAFWAARYRELPGTVPPGGVLAPADALRGVARLADQSGYIAHRLDRLAGTSGWPASVRRLRGPASAEEVPERLESLVDAAVSAYLGLGRAAPVLLVHAATAPNAVRHILPVLPARLWTGGFAAAWAAAAAIVATYAPADPAPHPEPAGLTPAAALERAADHGDEHVLKFTDTAVEAFDRTGDPAHLAAAAHARTLIPSPWRMRPGGPARRPDDQGNV
ncbi:questin oxidase family protein [Actinomadura sp. K4S16]|uniref:questin oxidase family protein n=1 Tax=Actinomadura sp. K4S16 TaxID=1316147 RepID=UPI0011EC3C1A|nr:questin oxidase family protein [Actinomadura sp. K4S16]